MTVTTGDRTLVLASGGLDSSTLIALLAKEQGVKPFALFIDRGQDVLVKERACVQTVCEQTDTQWDQISVAEWRRKIPPGIEMLDVPRNGIFALLAYPFALAQGCSAIALGSNTDDRTTPDSNAGFFTALNGLLDAFGQKVVVTAPFLDRDWGKREIARWAVENMGKGFVLSTYSCYENDRRMCGLCSGCKKRIAALSAFEIDEDTAYRERPKGP